ncbi:hypothetical protein EAG_04870 [Camponotus floridanus]|uniref:Uncharacterized protein n=1 Tax=Camponotus floridanus TaxID=104421 RepID=E2ASJ9_CAMFO|nr:hypothetical protein EAG_04870 [Camponotus floridanus]
MLIYRHVAELNQKIKLKDFITVTLKHRLGNCHTVIIEYPVDKHEDLAPNSHVKLMSSTPRNTCQHRTHVGIALKSHVKKLVGDEKTRDLEKKMKDRTMTTLEELEAKNLPIGSGVQQSAGRTNTHQNQNVQSATRVNVLTVGSQAKANACPRILLAYQAMERGIHLRKIGNRSFPEIYPKKGYQSKRRAHVSNTRGALRANGWTDTMKVFHVVDPRLNHTDLSLFKVENATLHKTSVCLLGSTIEEGAVQRSKKSVGSKTQKSRKCECISKSVRVHGGERWFVGIFGKCALFQHLIGSTWKCNGDEQVRRSYQQCVNLYQSYKLTSHLIRMVEYSHSKLNYYSCPKDHPIPLGDTGWPTRAPASNSYVLRKSRESDGRRNTSGAVINGDFSSKGTNVGMRCSCNVRYVFLTAVLRRTGTKERPSSESVGGKVDVHNRAPENVWTVNGGNCEHVQIYIGGNEAYEKEKKRVQAKGDAMRNGVNKVSNNDLFTEVLYDSNNSYLSYDRDQDPDLRFENRDVRVNLPDTLIALLQGEQHIMPVPLNRHPYCHPWLQENVKLERTKATPVACIDAAIASVKDNSKNTVQLVNRCITNLETKHRAKHYRSITSVGSYRVADASGEGDGREELSSATSAITCTTRSDKQASNQANQLVRQVGISASGETKFILNQLWQPSRTIPANSTAGVPQQPPEYRFAAFSLCHSSAFNIGTTD